MRKFLLHLFNALMLLAVLQLLIIHIGLFAELVRITVPALNNMVFTMLSIAALSLILYAVNLICYKKPTARYIFFPFALYNYVCLGILLASSVTFVMSFII